MNEKEKQYKDVETEVEYYGKEISECLLIDRVLKTIQTKEGIKTIVYSKQFRGA